MARGFPGELAAREEVSGWQPEAVSKLRRDELHESPIVRKSPKKSGTRVTRLSELTVLRRSQPVAVSVKREYPMRNTA